MKKLLLMTLATLTIGSSTLIADNDSGLYISLGYASANIDVTIDGLDADKQKILDSSTDSVILMAGYDFNNYFGVEGRYYVNGSSLAYDYYLGDTLLSGEYKAESFALYAKPQYNFGLITVYALAGVSFNDYTIDTLLGGNQNDALFSWGGVKIQCDKSLGIFSYYTDLGKMIDSPRQTYHL